eukprot:TRINITY_DN7688_c0_g1_i1.p1 TRINITY_DN7688_c0_g1~~TRINITY_DN7688_c0_g1_i1.p1  ORF type:complete len:643 (-),score=97.89 TRINITY_DN7688_c0_g1_i1:73-1971(-)
MGKKPKFVKLKPFIETKNTCTIPKQQDISWDAGFDPNFIDHIFENAPLLCGHFNTTTKCPTCLKTICIECLVDSICPTCNSKLKNIVPMKKGEPCILCDCGKNVRKSKYQDHLDSYCDFDKKITKMRKKILSLKSPMQKYDGSKMSVLHEMCDKLDKPIRVAIIGEMNSGKTTFINRLIGSDLFEVDVDNTMLDCLFRYSPDEEIKYFVKYSGNSIELKISSFDYSQYTVDANSPTVDYIVVEGPFLFLKDLNIELYDTPGCDDTQVMGYDTVANSADAAIIILTQEKILSEANRESLEKFPKAFVVINKCDRVTTKKGWKQLRVHSNFLNLGKNFDNFVSLREADNGKWSEKYNVMMRKFYSYLRNGCVEIMIQNIQQKLTFVEQVLILKRHVQESSYPVSVNYKFLTYFVNHLDLLDNVPPPTVMLSCGTTIFGYSSLFLQPLSWAASYFFSTYYYVKLVCNIAHENGFDISDPGVQMLILSILSGSKDVDKLKKVMEKGYDGEAVVAVQAMYQFLGNIASINTKNSTAMLLQYTTEARTDLMMRAYNGKSTEKVLPFLKNHISRLSSTQEKALSIPVKNIPYITYDTLMNKVLPMSHALSGYIHYVMLQRHLKQLKGISQQVFCRMTLD